jgi:hypothetical protein
LQKLLNQRALQQQQCGFSCAVLPVPSWLVYRWLLCPAHQR